MNLRVFQIATGWARFRELAFSNSVADNIFIIPSIVLSLLNSSTVRPLTIPNLILSLGKNRWFPA